MSGQFKHKRKKGRDCIAEQGQGWLEKASNRTIKG